LGPPQDGGCGAAQQAPGDAGRSSPREVVERLPPTACSQRTRSCLLKGCEQAFQPRHPLARYCGPACQAAARCWSRSRAAARYRTTEHGRACRRQQVCRYRQRMRERRQAAAEAQAETTGEGHQEAEDSEKIRCHRPGCYERFSLHRRSPCQRFCGPLCRQALRRVRERERRWLVRWASRPRRQRPSRYRVMEDG
jgi:hypothetical protein